METDTLKPDVDDDETDGPSKDELARIQQRWLNRIKREQKAHEEYRKRASEVEEIFRMNLDDAAFEPLYWSVVGVEHVGVYSNQPSPDVRPRNEKQNPSFVAVSQLISRGIEFCVDEKSFDDNFHRTVDDFLAMGLGVPRVKIDSVITTTITEKPIMGPAMNPPMNPMMGPPQPPEMMQIGVEQVEENTVGDQTLRWEYTPWSCFGWEPCNNWRHCDWTYYKHPMTSLQAKKRFGKKVAFKTEDDQKRAGTDDWKGKNGYIYEVWDREKRQVLFIAMGEDEPLEIREDPLGLKDFYPGPLPMMTNVGSEELIPKPDYDYIEQYDMELQRLQERRSGLLEQIKAAGGYDEGMPELGEMMELEDGEYKPIKNMLARFSATGGSMENALYHLPLKEKAEVLRMLTEQIAFVKSQVDEALGISDIVRGVTTASETATAQEIKGRWVGVRLTRKREIVMYTVREMMRIMAQLLATHITTENLSRMTQMEITEEMKQILQNDMLMEFSIDIETDSTIAKDEFKERETFQEMLNGVAQFAQSVLPMVQANNMPADVSSAILRAALSPYARTDRGLEEALATLPQTTQQLMDQGQQLQQAQQELQNTQMQMQQWQQLATTLQQQSTEANSKLKEADAELKRLQGEKVKAETREKMSGSVPLARPREIAEIDEIRARAEQARMPNTTAFGQSQ